jgi:hypothetical protein
MCSHLHTYQGHINDPVSSLDCIASHVEMFIDWRVMEGTVNGGNLKQCSGIWLERQKKTMKDLRQDSHCPIKDLNCVLSRYDSGMSVFQLTSLDYRDSID